jgi:hypothetical protein
MYVLTYFQIVKGQKIFEAIFLTNFSFLLKNSLKPRKIASEIFSRLPSSRKCMKSMSLKFFFSFLDEGTKIKPTSKTKS